MISTTGRRTRTSTLEYGKIIFRRNQEPGTFTDYWDEVTGSRARIVGDEETDVDSGGYHVGHGKFTVIR
ncbi:hypothetical protein KAU45_09930 [bacterium]|nr:hypothetical protein [bacterium]